MTFDKTADLEADLDEFANRSPECYFCHDPAQYRCGVHEWESGGMGYEHISHRKRHRIPHFYGHGYVCNCHVVINAEGPDECVPCACARLIGEISRIRAEWEYTKQITRDQATVEWIAAQFREKAASMQRELTETYRLYLSGKLPLSWPYRAVVEYMYGLYPDFTVDSAIMAVKVHTEDAPISLDRRLFARDVLLTLIELFQSYIEGDPNYSYYKGLVPGRAVATLAENSRRAKEAVASLSP